MKRFGLTFVGIFVFLTLFVSNVYAQSDPVVNPFVGVVDEAALDLIQDGSDLAAGSVTGSNPSLTSETTTGSLVFSDPDGATVTGVAVGDSGGADVSGNVNIALSGSLGDLKVTATGALIYTLTVNSTGHTTQGTSSDTVTDVFSYTVTDGLSNTSTTTITISVLDDVSTANDDSVALGFPTMVIAGATVNVSIADGVFANDTKSADGTTVTGLTGGSIGVALETSLGFLTLNADGSLSYQAKAAVSGLDSFTYTITDGDGDTDSATLNADVHSGLGIPTDTDPATNEIDETTAATSTAAFRSVGITVNATLTGGVTSVFYRLLNKDGLFSIDSVSGVVSSVSFLDFETATSHTITVQATANDGQVTQQDFTINVLDLSGATASDINFNRSAHRNHQTITLEGNVTGIVTQSQNGTFPVIPTTAFEETLNGPSEGDDAEKFIIDTAVHPTTGDLYIIKESTSNNLTNVLVREIWKIDPDTAYRDFVGHFFPVYEQPVNKTKRKLTPGGGDTGVYGHSLAFNNAGSLFIGGYEVGDPAAVGFVDTLVNGQIITVPKANLVDGETFLLKNEKTGLHFPTSYSATFEFDTGGGVAAGNVQVDISSDVTALDVANTIKAAIDSEPNLNLLTALSGNNVTFSKKTFVEDPVGDFISFSETIVDNGFIVATDDRTDTATEILNPEPLKKMIPVISSDKLPTEVLFATFDPTTANILYTVQLVGVDTVIDKIDLSLCPTYPGVCATGGNGIVVSQTITGLSLTGIAFNNAATELLATHIQMLVAPDINNPSDRDVFVIDPALIAAKTLKYTLQSFWDVGSFTSSISFSKDDSKLYIIDVGGRVSADVDSGRPRFLTQVELVTATGELKTKRVINYSTATIDCAGNTISQSIMTSFGSRLKNCILTSGAFVLDRIRSDNSGSIIENNTIMGPAARGVELGARTSDFTVIKGNTITTNTGIQCFKEDSAKSLPSVSGNSGTKALANSPVATKSISVLVVETLLVIIPFVVLNK